MVEKVDQPTAVRLTYDQTAMLEILKVVAEQIRTNRLVGLCVQGLTPDGQFLGEHLTARDFLMTMRGLLAEAGDRLRDRYGDGRKQPGEATAEDKARLYDPSGATLE